MNYHNREIVSPRAPASLGLSFGSLVVGRHCPRLLLEPLKCHPLIPCCLKANVAVGKSPANLGLHQRREGIPSHWRFLISKRVPGRSRKQLRINKTPRRVVTRRHACSWRDTEGEAVHSDTSEWTGETGGREAPHEPCVWFRELFAGRHCKGKARGQPAPHFTHTFHLLHYFCIFSCSQSIVSVLSQLYSSPEADKAKVKSMGGNQSQGAIYQTRGACGKQLEKESAPEFRCSRLQLSSPIFLWGLRAILVSVLSFSFPEQIRIIYSPISLMRPCSLFPLNYSACHLMHS